jgi:hypothetical protein
MRMKAKFLPSYLTILLLVCSVFVKAQNNPLTGEWKLNKEKTVLAANQLFLLKIAIQVKGDSLLTTRTYQNTDGQEYPFNENLSLSGKESKIVIYDMPRTAKATLSKADGSIALESTTTFYRDGQEVNFKAQETWKVESENKLLSIISKFTTSAGEVSLTSFFDRVK